MAHHMMNHKYKEDMTKDQALIGVVVCLYEVTGEKDEEGKHKPYLLQCYDSPHSSWGTVSTIGQSFADYAENLGVAYKVDYFFTVDESYY